MGTPAEVEVARPRTAMFQKFLKQPEKPLPDKGPVLKLTQVGEMNILRARENSREGTLQINP